MDGLDLPRGLEREIVLDERDRRRSAFGTTSRFSRPFKLWSQSARPATHAVNEDSDQTNRRLRRRPCLSRLNSYPTSERRRETITIKTIK